MHTVIQSRGLHFDHNEKTLLASSHWESGRVELCNIQLTEEIKAFYRKPFFIFSSLWLFEKLGFKQLFLFSLSFQRWQSYFYSSLEIVKI